MDNWLLRKSYGKVLLPRKLRFEEPAEGQVKPPMLSIAVV
jgi:hypothetical protein